MKKMLINLLRIFIMPGIINTDSADLESNHQYTIIQNR